MTTVETHDPRAGLLLAAIRTGDADGLRRHLDEHVSATWWLGDDEPDGMARSLLHVATDWPGHFPHVAHTIGVLVAAGADVNARFRGHHAETPLHWAASSDDVEALDALLDAGADIDADGGVIAGGTPLDDATAFAQWAAARRLVTRGARTSLGNLAALGMTDELLARLDGPESTPAGELDALFWSACHGGHLATAHALAGRGAEINWLPTWETSTPLDAAARSGAHDVVRWLHTQGAVTCSQLGDK
jgi:ankyrin repeat protein